MQYRYDIHHTPVSVLGFGCMRLSRKNGHIDLDKAEREILEAVRLGINYFDTAYLYPGNEQALGTILERTKLRNRVFIATKLPQYLVRKPGQIEQFFQEELLRLKTDHIDYYLMHHVTDLTQWNHLLSFGIQDWIKKKKTSGQIRNIGFSYHGNTEEFLKILDAYPWDFCQIQYNYMDETIQAGRIGLNAAAEKGIPVIIMEPLRGGKLVNLLPKEAKDLIAESGSGYSAAEYAFRWLYDQPQVTCVLSGMNSIEMIQENSRIASEAVPGSLTANDRVTIETLRRIICLSEKVGCTGCGYCMPCPNNVDIPATFRSFNLLSIEDNQHAVRIEYLRLVGLKKSTGFATQCIGCGACELHCPQKIPIREKMKEATRSLLPFPYRIGIAVARKLMIPQE